MKIKTITIITALSLLGLSISTSAARSAQPVEGPQAPDAHFPGDDPGSILDETLEPSPDDFLVWGPVVDPDEADVYLKDAQSTTGPLPPDDLDPGYQLRSPDAVTILNVPAYLWTNGCGPTAAGMVLGYWDSNGFDNLVSGSAATQTAAVNAMISSTGNYNDYCLPLDYYPDPIAADLSELPVGDEHPDDSVADFMKTSQSIYDNYYGWSYFRDVENALENYVEFAAPEYTGNAQSVYFGSLSWEAYKAEIDAGRPVVFLVDTDADGSTDHFVPGIGYNDDGGTNLYGCLDTWDTSVHWYEYAAIAVGQSWGIYGATLFEIDVDTYEVVINEVDPDTPDVVELYNTGNQAVDMTGWELIINSASQYTFPSFSLPVGAYVVVEEFGNPLDNTATHLYTGGNLSLVQSSGAVGLINAVDSGVDFVRWGDSATDPPAGTTWTGVNPVALSTGLTLGRDDDSLDTDDGSDWCIQLPSLGDQNDGCSCALPGTPLLYSPLETRGIVYGVGFSFQWNSSENATDYQLQVDDDFDFSSPEIDLIVAGTLYTPPTPLDPGTHFWRVRGRNTSDGCDQYGVWSKLWQLQITTENSFDIISNLAASIPTLDGTISTGEWSDAAVYDITVPPTASSTGWLSVTLYVMNDVDYLYLAIDNPNDTTYNSHDQIGIYFDDNPLPSDGLWTNTTCGNPDGEGNIWVFANSSPGYREWISGPAVCSTIYDAPGVMGDVSLTSGHVQGEAAIDLGVSALRAVPGDNLAMQIMIWDYNNGTFLGLWPFTAYFVDPSTYRSLTLAEVPGDFYKAFLPLVIR